MPNLIYSAIASLDGYIADENDKLPTGRLRTKKCTSSSMISNGPSGRISTVAGCTKR